MRVLDRRKKLPQIHENRWWLIISLQYIYTSYIYILVVRKKKVLVLGQAGTSLHETRDSFSLASQCTPARDIGRRNSRVGAVHGAACLGGDGLFGAVQGCLVSAGHRAPGPFNI